MILGRLLHRTPIRRAAAAWRGLTCLLLPAFAALGGIGELRAQLEPYNPGPGEPVTLELVLAVDVSSSVSVEEFDLQMKGFADAFRDPSVISAISASGPNGVAVAMIQWSDNRRQQVAVDWARLTDESTIEAFAVEIDQTPRFLDGGGTAIGGAIAFALSQLDRNGYEGTRQVIDISGDGRANQGAQPESLRDVAILQGVTINGLAILNEDSHVAAYYRNSVIGGPGAFVMTANDYEAFAQAIIQKLVKEIGAVPVVEAPRGAPGTSPGQPESANQTAQNSLPGAGHPQIVLD